jgi:hypothetical protein
VSGPLTRDVRQNNDDAVLFEERKDNFTMESLSKDQPIYLRRDEWCQLEHSCNASSKQLEAGVSVFECDNSGNGKWRGVGPAFSQHERSFRGQGRKLLDGLNSTWYLVTGDMVGTGGDSEPLLKNVKPLKVVKWDKVDYFVEAEDVTQIEFMNHPGYPNCYCDSVEDVLPFT